MNIPKLLEKYAGKDCRRIDLAIGEKEFWGAGLGTEVIRTLTKSGFEKEGADMIFGLGNDYNRRSIGAFKKAVYEIEAKVEASLPAKSQFDYDLVIRKEQYWQKLNTNDSLKKFN